MVTKTIEINVNDSDLDSLNKDLLKTSKNIDKVEGSAKNADAGLKKVGDNGGLISTLDAFTGGLATRLRDAAEASKVFSFNLKGIQAAIIATGIGGLVIALSLVVAYWDDIKGSVTGVSSELEDQIALQKEINREAEFQLKAFEAGENVLRLQGKSEQEILELKKKRIELVLETTKAELEYQEQQLQGQIEAEDNAKRIFATLTSVGTQFLTTLASGIDGLLSKLGIDIGLAEKVGEVRGSVFDSLFGSAESIETRKKEIDDLTLAIIQQQDKLAAMELSRREGTKSEDGGAVQALPLTGLAGFDALDETINSEFNILALNQSARTKMEQAESMERRRIADAEAQAKSVAFMVAADAFSSAADLIGKQTAAGKALAIAGALIATYQSAVNSYNSLSPIPIYGPALGAVAAAAAVASGLANVKSIASVKVPGQGGGGAASPSRPPAFNVVDASAENQLNQSLLEQNTEPVQAFVVDKEVTTQQELSRNKIESSSLG